MNWDLVVLPPAVNKMSLEAIQPIFTKLLNLGAAVSNRYRPLTDPDSKVSCFGLTFLAVRQATAVHTLLKANLDDQAVTIARSLYETLVNLVVILRLELLDKAGDYVESSPQQVEETAKKFLDYHRAVNQTFLDSMEKQVSDLEEAKRNNRSRRPDPIILEEVSKWISTHKNRIETEYADYKAEYVREKPPQYWNNKNPIEAARQTGISFSQVYSWCCGFSHSNAYAVRLLLSADNSQGIYSPRPWGNFRQGLVFFSTWSLANCLSICFRYLDGYDNELLAVQKLVAPLQSSTG